MWFWSMCGSGNKQVSDVLIFPIYIYSEKNVLPIFQWPHRCMQWASKGPHGAMMAAWLVWGLHRWGYIDGWPKRANMGLNKFRNCGTKAGATESPFDLKQHRLNRKSMPNHVRV